MEANENWNSEDMDNGIDHGMFTGSEATGDYETAPDDAASEYNSADEGDFDSDESLDTDYDASENESDGDWDTTETFDNEEDL